MSSALRKQFRLLLEDALASFAGWRLWTHLGWNDVAKQYRRSFVGPLWITLNTAIFVVGFGFIGSQLFKMPVEEYLPFFCLGHIFFTYFTSLINDGCLAYVSADAFLKQTPYPKIAFVLRVIWRNTILLAHNFIVILGVLIWTGKLGEASWTAFAAGAALTLTAAILVVGILGALATRFRDIPMVVSSIMQLAFFATPVMWRADQLTERARWVADINPLAAYIDLLRSPLLGGSASEHSWWMAILTIGVLVPLFVLIYLFARRRIVYWL